MKAVKPPQRHDDNANPFKIAQAIQFENQMKRITNEIEKLMGIVAQHGIKIKEIATIASNSVSQVEFMSAITTTRFQALNVAKAMKDNESSKNKDKAANATNLNLHENDDKDANEMKQLKLTIQQLESEQYNANFKNNMDNKKLENEIKLTKKEFIEMRNYIYRLEAKLETFVDAVEDAGISTNVSFQNPKHAMTDAVNNEAEEETPDENEWRKDETEHLEEVLLDTEKELGEEGGDMNDSISDSENTTIVSSRKMSLMKPSNVDRRESISSGSRVPTRMSQQHKNSLGTVAEDQRSDSTVASPHSPSTQSNPTTQRRNTKFTANRISGIQEDIKRLESTIMENMAIQFETMEAQITERCQPPSLAEIIQEITRRQEQVQVTKEHAECFSQTSIDAVIQEWELIAEREMRKRGPIQPKDEPILTHDEGEEERQEQQQRRKTKKARRRSSIKLPKEPSYHRFRKPSLTPTLSSRSNPRQQSFKDTLEEEHGENREKALVPDALDNEFEGEEAEEEEELEGEEEDETERSPRSASSRPTTGQFFPPPSPPGSRNSHKRVSSASSRPSSQPADDPTSEDFASLSNRFQLPDHLQPKPFLPMDSIHEKEQDEFIQRLSALPEEILSMLNQQDFTERISLLEPLELEDLSSVLSSIIALEGAGGGGDILPGEQHDSNHVIPTTILSKERAYQLKEQIDGMIPRIGEAGMDNLDEEENGEGIDPSNRNKGSKRAKLAFAITDDLSSHPSTPAMRPPTATNTLNQEKPGSRMTNLLRSPPLTVTTPSTPGIDAAVTAAFASEEVELLSQVEMPPLLPNDSPYPKDTNYQGPIPQRLLLEQQDLQMTAHISQQRRQQQQQQQQRQQQLQTTNQSFLSKQQIEQELFKTMEGKIILKVYDVIQRKLMKLCQELNQRFTIIDKHTIKLIEQTNHLYLTMEQLIPHHQYLHQQSQGMIQTIQWLYQQQLEIQEYRQETFFQPFELLFTSHSEQLDQIMERSLKVEQRLYLLEQSQSLESKQSSSTNNNNNNNDINSNAVAHPTATTNNYNNSSSSRGVTPPPPTVSTSLIYHLPSVEVSPPSHHYTHQVLSSQVEVLTQQLQQMQSQYYLLETSQEMLTKRFEQFSHDTSPLKSTQRSHIKPFQPTITIPRPSLEKEMTSTPEGITKEMILKSLAEVNLEELPVIQPIMNDLLQVKKILQQLSMEVLQSHHHFHQQQQQQQQKQPQSRPSSATNSNNAHFPKKGRNLKMMTTSSSDPPNHPNISPPTIRFPSKLTANTTINTNTTAPLSATEIASQRPPSNTSQHHHPVILLPKALKRSSNHSNVAAGKTSQLLQPEPTSNITATTTMNTSSSSDHPSSTIGGIDVSKALQETQQFLAFKKKVLRETEVKYSPIPPVKPRPPPYFPPATTSSSNTPIRRDHEGGGGGGEWVMTND